MTTDDILEMMRQNIGEAVATSIGCEPPEYSDAFLIKYVKSSNFKLKVLGVISSGISYAVDTTAITITPEPTLAIGVLLATGASAAIIRDDLLNRLRNGELGLSFTSGATSITTNQASINLKTSSDALMNEFTWLLAAYLSGDPNAILGRDQ